MKTILSKINAEPVLVFALVQALIGLVSAFGFDLSAEQTTSLLLVTGAVLAIVCRGRVTPVASETPERNEVGAVGDAVPIILVAILLGVVLLLFGIRF